MVTPAAEVSTRTCLDCHTVCVPQSQWRAIPALRETYQPWGAHGRCQNCYQNWYRGTTGLRRTQPPDTPNQSVLLAGWRDHAACVGRDPSWWDITASPNELTAAAAICSTCPVAEPCATDAEQYGATDTMRAGHVHTGTSIRPVASWLRLGERHCVRCRTRITVAQRRRYCSLECRRTAEQVRDRARHTARTTGTTPSRPVEVGRP